MFGKRFWIVSGEIILLLLVFLIIIGPMMSVFIWSVAIRWYWPNTLPQEVGLEYWRQALGLQKSLAIGAVSIMPAFVLSLTIAVIVVFVCMLLSIPAGYTLASTAFPSRRRCCSCFSCPTPFPSSRSSSTCSGCSPASGWPARSRG